MSVASPMAERMSGWQRAVRPLLPGLALAAAVALVARLVGQFLPPSVSEVLVAVLLGIVLANSVGLPDAAKPGVRFALQRVLRLGIILLGARLSLLAVAAIGLQAVGLVVLLMALALAFAYLVGRVFGLPPRLALLIGVGTAVCGNSAIVATAPVVQAEEREVSFAVATITLFGTLAVFLYPLLGLAIGLPQPAYGVWAGTAVNDTSQVVAAGTAYGAAALSVATVVKLTRNALMAPLLLGIAWWWGRGPGAAARGAKGAVPLFVFGFLALALLRTIGVIDRPMASLLDEVAKACILVALAAVGLNTSLRQMRSMGLKSFYLGLAVSAVLAALSLALILAFGISPSV